jgi:hypothetical protein
VFWFLLSLSASFLAQHKPLIRDSTGATGPITDNDIRDDKNGSGIRALHVTASVPGAFRLQPITGRHRGNGRPTNLEEETARRTQDIDDYRAIELGRQSNINSVVLEATPVEGEDRRHMEQLIREEYLNSAVTGEVTTIPPTNNNLKRTIAILAVILVIGVVVVGIVVSVVVERDQQIPITAAPSTQQPTTTTMPSDGPTNMPSFQPSVAPSRSIANLNNGNVSEPHPLILGNAPLVNKLSNAADSFVLVECGAFSAQGQTSLWYSFRPTISGPVTLIVCNGTEATVEVQSYTGVAFGCPVIRISNGDMGNCDGLSVSWDAQIGSNYYASVSPPWTSNSTTEDDEFTIQLLDNDQCDHAIGPVTPTSVGIVMAYDTTNANIDREAGMCGGASASASPGVWYQVQGTGHPITASTCSDDPTFDTQLSVFQGDCGDLVCVNGNNNFCGNQSMVAWPSISNETYHVLVHGYDGASGAFNLTLSTDVPRKENDFCTSAVRLGVGDTAIFSFSGSSADPDLPVCQVDMLGVYDTGTTDDFPYGIWYSLLGTGLNISASMNVGTASPVMWAIYSGSACGSLSCLTTDVGPGSGCIGDADGYLSCQETRCISTKDGEVYYVFVSTSAIEHVDDEHRLTINVCE